jgi:glycosyltransferase involved in cell wall biosynthesis
MQLTDAPFVSVIIPAKNARSYIEKCILAVRENSYPSEKTELIVVDNGSTDSTTEISSRLADKVLTMQEGTISAARNKGASVARGEILAFLDADCIPVPGWLSAGVNTVLEYKGLVGANYSVPENPVWIESVWFRNCHQEVMEVHHLPAGNLFISAELFNSIAGFNESLITGEDSELCTRVKKIAPVVSNPDISVIHLGNPKTLLQHFKREIWLGLGGAYLYRDGRVNKPLIMTLFFVSGTVLQLVGATGLLFGQDWLNVLLYGTILISLVLLATLFARRKSITSLSAIFQLAVLYYIFYAGRAVSLFFLLCNRNYYHRP